MRRTLLTKKLPITDVYPTYLPDGQIIYTDKKPALGETQQTPIASNVTPQDVTAYLSDGTKVDITGGIITVTLPNGFVTKQPFNSKGLGDAVDTGNKMVGIGGTVMAIGAVIPPPADAVVVAVGAIITAIGALVKLFAGFGSAKIKELNDEAQKYEDASAKLQDQNNQLDAKISELKTKIDAMKQALGITIPGYGSASVVNGLGFCLINCGQIDAAQARLDKAKALFNSLIAQQAEKVQTAYDMSVFVNNLLRKQNYRTAIFVALGLGLVFFGTIIIQKKFSK